jgi:hypothetical protein
MGNMKWWSLAVIAILIVGGCVVSADASVTLRLRDLNTGATVVVADGSALDANLNADAVTFVGQVGNFYLNVTTASSDHGLTQSVLDLNSIDARYSSLGAGSLQVAAEDTFFLAGDSYPSLNLLGAVGGTLCPGSATFQSWVNTNDLVPDYTEAVLTAPAGSVPVWSGSGFNVVNDTSPVLAFSSLPASKNFTPAGPYALFVQATLNFSGEGTMSFNESQNVNVPEPATMIVWGLLGVIAGAYGVRRRRAG